MPITLQTALFLKKRLRRTAAESNYIKFVASELQVLERVVRYLKEPPPLAHTSISTETYSLVERMKGPLDSTAVPCVCIEAV